MNEVYVKAKLTAAEKFATCGGITAFGVLLSSLIGHNFILQLLLSFFVIYLMTGPRLTIVFAAVVKFKRDMIAARRFLGQMILNRRWVKNNESVGSIFQKNVEKHPNKIAFMSVDDKKISFQEVEDLSNRIGRYFSDKGYKQGDCIALLMENRVEYPAMWLGLSKAGIITALLNYNLRKETLIHSIRTAYSKAVIVSSELLEALREIIDDEEISKLEIFVYDTQNGNEIKLINEKSVNLHKELEKTSSAPLKDIGIKPKDKLFYIYTSGTTGMPKAAVITHVRFMFVASAACKIFAMTREEIIYNTLPMYHTAGGMIGVGNILLFGTTMVMRKKFSASNFWTDCVKFECTAAQYIGELCRFLLLTPSKPEESSHKIRLAFGNGLRPQIWTEFQERFKIKDIGEIYGATESNANLANIDSTPGAIGFIPQLARPLYPVELIKCDEETGEPIRGDDGFCIKCDYGEPGVFIGKIANRDPARAFSGYSDKKASEKKIIRDVFKKGDSFFNSGDILVMDVYGYYYFKDRTGDTFRWRGENVATSEVEGIMMNVAELNDCVVYGVEVPGTEGKAGMAALMDPDNKIDMTKIARGIRDRLPAYARPVFIRIMDKLPMTGTYKLKKRDLQLEGFDITKINDPIYLLQSDGSYKLMTEEQNNEIKEGRAKL